ncbi:MAG: hypothetical protein JWM93_2488, partial [Frankiales bacterium]|nr:hypothetical protein [Frankiales bacterium]
MKRTMASSSAALLAALATGMGMAACEGSVPAPPSSESAPLSARGVTAPAERPPRPPRVVTLAFAGDLHFQLHLAALLDDPRGLGPITRALAGADVAMVNLESAITERG